MTIRFSFAWYDLWVGVFWDAHKRRLYILPIPCCGIVLQFRRRRPTVEELVAILNADPESPMSGRPGPPAP